MPRIQVGHCVRSFEEDLLTIGVFLEHMRSFQVKAGQSAYHPIGIRTAELLTGLQLLRMHLAWEDFLEGAFLRYMCGGTSQSGFSPILLLGTERSMARAMSTLLGDRRYVQWTPHDTIVQAQRYFHDAEPFRAAMASAMYELESILTIRNRFAHRSEHANTQFRELVRNELGYNPPGMTPGRLLLTVRRRGRAPQPTYFQHYSNVLLSVAYLIVP